jgi:hypothetical protein
MESLRDALLRGTVDDMLALMKRLGLHPKDAPFYDGRWDETGHYDLRGHIVGYERQVRVRRLVLVACVTCVLAPVVGEPGGAVRGMQTKRAVQRHFGQRCHLQSSLSRRWARVWNQVCGTKCVVADGCGAQCDRGHLAV